MATGHKTRLPGVVCVILCPVELVLGRGRTLCPCGAQDSQAPPLQDVSARGAFLPAVISVVDLEGGRRDAQHWAGLEPGLGGQWGWEHSLWEKAGRGRRWLRARRRVS